MKIGIDLGGTNMRVALVDGDTIRQRVIRPCPAEEAEQVVTNQLLDQIREVMNPEVTGIGVGVPSVVDAEKGIVYNVANIPAWQEVHLKEILEKEFGIPARINNDSNCFTLGVNVFGEGKAFKNIVGVTMGTGIGSGIIVDGKLYGGRNTGAGEIGALPYLTMDYEHYCSSGFFTKFHGRTGKELGELAALGDPKALAVWDEFGEHVGNLMQVVLYTYDPEAIIIGGGIASAFTYFEKAMWAQLAKFPYSETVKHIKIITSTLEDAALLGASAL
jgi:glucokinase